MDYDYLINKIWNENCLDTMARMPDNFIDLTVTSPPYDSMRDYNGYVFSFEETAKELLRVTKGGGVVVWVVADATINGSETGTSFKQALFFKEIGFNLHDTMIYKKLGVGSSGSNLGYPQAFEYMFIFSKGKPKTINHIRDVENVESGQLRKYAKSRSNIRGYLNEMVKKEVFRNTKRDNVWHYTVGFANKSDITGHPAVFPEGLPRDHIYSWSNEGELIYDPLGGSGTTARSAILLKRNWIISEISLEYCKIAKKRLEPHIKQLNLI